jgi:hypothetical protein
MSNKVFVYLAGVQLLLSHGWRSAVPSLCGLVASAVGLCTRCVLHH